MGPSDIAGRALGAVLSPVTAAISALRRARMFHPEGATYLARVAALPLHGELTALARGLEGPALARLSTALWRSGREWPDVLGCALRLRGDATPSPLPAPGDQDLLFATIRAPWTLPFAPLTTARHDFLANDYYAVAPFRVAGLGDVKLRLVAGRARHDGRDRGDRLDRAVLRGGARLRLEVQRQHPRRAWQPVAEVLLLERAAIDQETLRFSPFRTGRGLVPRGFVHGLRAATYPSSQAVRPLHAGA